MCAEDLFRATAKACAAAVRGRTECLWRNRGERVVVRLRLLGGQFVPWHRNYVSDTVAQWHVVAQMASFTYPRSFFVVVASETRQTFLFWPLLFDPAAVTDST